jgi:hypothetical protein
MFEKSSLLHSKEKQNGAETGEESYQSFGIDEVR